MRFEPAHRFDPAKLNCDNIQVGLSIFWLRRKPRATDAVITQ
jgi:hypothetical protein